MSGFIQSNIQCDECGTAYNYYEGHQIPRLREEAKLDGWVYYKVGRTMSDYCSDCKKKEPQ